VDARNTCRTISTTVILSEEGIQKHSKHREFDYNGNRNWIPDYSGMTLIGRVS